jgi:hypothetical protein
MMMLIPNLIKTSKLMITLAKLRNIKIKLLSKLVKLLHLKMMTKGVMGMAN